VIQADLAIRRAGELATMVPTQGDVLGRISNGALAARDGFVVWVGPEADLEREVDLDGDQIDAQGACLMPGFVDPHTHPVFAGVRADEFAERQAGATYRAQQSGERGIMRTVRATREAGKDVLVELAKERADRFLANGTTTIEAKTGYGLNLADESTSLDVLAALATDSRLRIAPTFLGAHTVPAGTNREAYVRLITEEMLPAFKGRARFCDAWCDDAAFTPGETRTILRRAEELGYKLRLHAAQLGPGEGPDIAAELRACSADHLEYVTPAQLRALRSSGTVAVLCPSANFTTHGPRPPIEAMRESGVTIAVASDLNPGTSNSENLPHAMTLACVLWGMTPAEVLLGATVNAARSLRLDGVVGCLRPGATADCILLDVENVESLPYYVGINRVIRTVVGGVTWQPS
jgi:imidazolonepropionase